GQTLNVTVGCRNGYGWSRGGPGGPTSTFPYGFSGGANGGGSTAIVAGTSTTPLLVVAGGGGGGGTGVTSFYTGGDGGDGFAPGYGAGNGSNGTGPGAGAGGAGGGNSTADGAAGDPADNGSGGGGGGGGGGGYPHGGARGEGGASGGGGGGGGGAGQTFADPAVVSVVSMGPDDQAEDGKVTFIYTGPAGAPQVFQCTGSFATYTVPDNVTSLLVTALGADGSTAANGFGEGGAPGLKAALSTTAQVTPGATLNVGVGCAGGHATDGGYTDNINPGGAGGFGYRSGGNGGNGDKPVLLPGGGTGGGGGGGASGLGYGTDPLEVTEAILVAAGGGGGGGAGDISFYACLGGNGGTADVSGGTSGICSNPGGGGGLGAAGAASGNGGAAATGSHAGGGGGGGGGCQNGGGGGGGGAGYGGGGGGGGGQSCHAITGVSNIQNVNIPTWGSANGVIIISPVFMTQAPTTTVVTVPVGAVYDGTPKTATAQTTGPGGVVVANPTVSYTPGPGAPVNAGTYTASASFPGNANYLPSSDSKTFTIAQAPSVTTVTANNATYDGQPHGGTAAVTGAGGLSQSLAVTYTGRNGTTYGPSATAPTAAGDYTASASYAGDANHTASQGSANFTIAKAALTVQADDQSRAYGAATPPLTGTLTGVVAGDGITASYSTTATASSPVGTYPIVPALADPNGKLANYTVTSANGTLTVTKAPLTVTANDATRVYGDPNPAFTATATGLVNGDTLASIGITCSSTATPASPVGTYDITCAGDPANYAVTFSKGTLTVTKAPTALVITSASALPLNGQGQVTVTARLTWHNGADPLAGKTVTFSAGGVSASGTTDANGVATAVLTLPSEQYTLTASFAGDTNLLPSQAAAQTVIVYLPSQFVIWGGNTPNIADTIKLGQTYQFWDSQWAQQVSGGDYTATNSFKGYANEVSADGKTWTSDPGNSSGPPATVPRYLGVIVATQVTKDGSLISGNIAELVVLRVDAPQNYQPSPGHTGSGVLVAILP
ncbi:MAG: MBG domain-containing protein, partial [Thermomicrobiales bacterium]